MTWCLEAGDRRCCKFSEKELFEAMENPDDYEALSDDFIAGAGGEVDSDEEDRALLGLNRSPEEKRMLGELLAQTRHLDLSSDERSLDGGVEAVVGVEELAALMAEEYNDDEIGEVS